MQHITGDKVVGWKGITRLINHRFHRDFELLGYEKEDR
jgi:hypothetical protein